MCGICGKVYYDRDRPVEEATLIRMCSTIRHRGPDEQGILAAGAVGLGSTRLSIIDVEGGHMPLSNEDESVWIVYNGELYNFPELRDQLLQAGHRFRTHTDTEVIVHLYEERGDDFVRHLNGIFALALWDGRRQRLVLARDHIGVKPLFYAQLPDRLLFGSEMKAILADGVSREIDPVALGDYLSLNYVPGPRTIFKEIRKLLPGHVLTYEAATGDTRDVEYWDLPLPNTRPVRARPGELEDALLDLLRTAVRDQMISDVPLGAFLSGGIDSSLIVALMSEVSAGPVKTFSIGFREESYDELPYARIVAERFGTEHHELVVEPSPEDTIRAMVGHFDEPFADWSAVAVDAVSALAAQHVKVALSGDGGDELFGGYYTYQADKLAALYRWMPGFIGSGLIPRLVGAIPTSDRKVSWDFKLKQFVGGAALPPLPSHAAWKNFLSDEMKSELLRPGSRDDIRAPVELLQAYYDGYPTDDLVDRMLYVDTKVQLVDDMLTKVDRMSMTHSLEVRVPLLDLRLVEFMARLPGDLKVRRLTLKYLMKRVAARVLPREILDRPKAGFHVPVPAWIKTEMAGMVRERLSPEVIAQQGYFEPTVVQRMLDAHMSGRQNYSRNLWNLLIFGLWHEQYVERVALIG